jgi:hypothetical protein
VPDLSLCAARQSGLISLRPIVACCPLAASFFERKSLKSRADRLDRRAMPPY